jgi:hypothetical protein
MQSEKQMRLKKGFEKAKKCAIVLAWTKPSPLLLPVAVENGKDKMKNKGWRRWSARRERNMKWTIAQHQGPKR